MNLVFDIGNTTTTVAVFDGKEKKTLFRTRELSCRSIEKKMSGFHIDKVIISSVRVIPDFILDLLTVDIPFFHIVSEKSRLPFDVDYESPATLGPDRIAAVAGAFEMFPGSEVLIIDAGSAITYDYLSGKTYRGGNISPGLQMRFKALHKYTGKLPLVDETEKHSSPGKDTRNAIAAGVVNGILYEINEYIRTFERMHPDPKIILTGGDGAFLKRQIRHQIAYMPEIVIDGLNYILEYNAE